MSSPRVWPVGHWPEADGRPRVLVEERDAAVRAVCERNLAADGYAVATCGGPASMGRCACPLTVGQPCALVEGADVLYTSLSWSQPQNVDILRSVRRTRPELPVIVEVAAPDVYRVDGAADGCELLLAPATRRRMGAAIASALSVPAASPDVKSVLS